MSRALPAAVRIPNPYVIGCAGPHALLPARICWVLETRIGAELESLRIGARGVDPELSYVLRAVREAAMAFVPPEMRREQDAAAASEHASDSGERWMGTAQAADVLGVRTSRAVVQAIARGTLPAVRQGRVWRLRRRDVESYRARCHK